MVNVIAVAASAATILGSLAGVFGYFAAKVKVKADYDIALRQYYAKGEADRALDAHTRRQDDLAEEAASLTQWRALYDAAVIDRDKWQKLEREARTDCEVMRTMWGRYGTTLEDVETRERARYEAMKGQP